MPRKRDFGVCSGNLERTTKKVVLFCCFSWLCLKANVLFVFVIFYFCHNQRRAACSSFSFLFPHFAFSRFRYLFLVFASLFLLAHFIFFVFSTLCICSRLFLFISVLFRVFIFLALAKIHDDTFLPYLFVSYSIHLYVY